MGQKVNPIGLRLGINKTWFSKWFATGKEYTNNLHEDYAVRKYVNKAIPNAGISKVIIERSTKKAVINLHVARPGVVIGKKGADIEDLRKNIAKLVDSEVKLNIIPVKTPDLDAQLLAINVARQIEKRVSFRKAMKKAMQQCLKAGALGIRVNTKGRLAGTDIARMEWYREGRVPLHTLRADIDYAEAEATTTYGIIGIKVWVYKGDVVEKQEKPVKTTVNNEVE
ncbi:30S ribosomal protein S3 [Rickettsiales bacterium LUAb2]